MKILFVFAVLLVFAHAHNNGLARTPTMGFNTWNLFQCTINETLLIDVIDGMVSYGLRELGYKYVVIDDCWEARERTSSGELAPNPERFPRGIKFLSDYAHSKGMYLGIYSDIGPLTCQKYPASYGHYEQDAMTFAHWGIDFLKLDFCNLVADQKDYPWKYYSQMSQALNKTGRPIVFNVCNWGVQQPWKWAPSMANSWRISKDIGPRWKTLMQIVDIMKPLYPYAGPGAWNDMDMLEVDVNYFGEVLSQLEARSHFAIWAFMPSPLILGNDIRLGKMDSWVKNVIGNEEMIAINQDSMGIQAKLFNETIRGQLTDDGGCLSESCSYTQVYARPLNRTSSNADFAVLLLNRAGYKKGSEELFHEENIRIDFSSLGIAADKNVTVRDIWMKKDLGIYRAYFEAKNVTPHDQITITLRL